MALFNKKKEGGRFNDIPKLPELPNLPNLPSITEEENYEKNIPVPQLPKFLPSSSGQKFSQNTIKEAITGKKEDRAFADEFASEGLQMMRKPQNKPLTHPMESMSVEMPSARYEYEPKKAHESAEPVFIRIDKFEEGMHALDSARKQISEVERTLRDIRKTREEEERELASWERDIQAAKEQIEKIDKDIFSKLE